MTLMVKRQFDTYAVGEVMTDAEVADQTRRGNLDDLVKNGYLMGFVPDGVAEDEEEIDFDFVDISSLSFARLKELAAEQEIEVDGRKKTDYIEALTAWQSTMDTSA